MRLKNFVNKYVYHQDIGKAGTSFLSFIDGGLFFKGLSFFGDYTGLDPSYGEMLNEDQFQDLIKKDLVDLLSLGFGSVVSHAGLSYNKYKQSLEDIED